tara:strand:+ start:937 stop:1716 length:780 start_codon:yes stop_codon:yes gene_type:complete
MLLLKKIINKILGFLGYKISKISAKKKPDLDYITQIFTEKLDPIIFDIGANKGQSIERYKKMFENCYIHSFEPNIDEINNLENKYKDEKRLFLNNLAIGEKEEITSFNINSISGHSSFLKVNPNTNWLKMRSKRIGVDPKNYTIKKVKTKLITLDKYAIDNQIDNIDILKIDTQGYEDKVLLGAKNLIEKNKIKIIQLELIFSQVYQKQLQIYDIEKILIPNKYKLFAISNKGSLNEDVIFQSDFLYLSSDKYEKFNQK